MNEEKFPSGFMQWAFCVIFAPVLLFAWACVYVLPVIFVLAVLYELSKGICP